jgi:hypothetical protein
MYQSTPNFCLIYSEDTDCNENHNDVTASRYDVAKTPAAKNMLEQITFLTAPTSS